MEEKIKNIEGAIILLTDILNSQGENQKRQEEMLKRQDTLITQLSANEIILNKKNENLAEALADFISWSKQVLHLHENRITNMEEKE